MTDAKGHHCLSVEIINALNLLYFSFLNMQDTAGLVDCLQHFI